jgi:hypothetical protein
MVSGLPLDNDKLMETIHGLARRNCTVIGVCRFKDWTYFVGTAVGNVINHHGVVLEIANASGAPEQFLQLEYGARGTFWQMSTAPYPDPRYGIVTMDKVAGMPCRYRCGVVAPENRNPERLLWFLKKYREQTYNIFHYNCIVFAEMVFKFHLPVGIDYNKSTECLTTGQMQKRYAEVTHHTSAPRGSITAGN